MACMTFNNSGAGDLISSQLATVSAKGNDAYDITVAALEQMRREFTGSFGPTGLGVSGGSSGLGATLVAQYPVSIGDYVKPERPADPEAAEFSMPDSPPDAVDAEGLIPARWLGDGALDEISRQYLVLKEYYDEWLERCSISDQLCSTLALMMSGEIALSDAAVQAMRDKARDEADRQATQAERTATDEWAARGFSMPAGVLDYKIATIRAEAWDKKGSLNRDIFVEEEKFALQSQQFGVSEAVKYEDITRNKATQLFETARQNVVAAFGFNESTAKLRLDEWRAQVDVFKTFVEAEKVRIDAVLAPLDYRVRRYATDAQVESSAIESSSRVAALNMTRMQTHGSLDAKALELDQQKLIEASKTALATFDAIARVGSQLAAGWTSALSMSASVGHSSGVSSSSSCSEQYRYSE